MECNPSFNLKGEKVDNLNNVRFSHNNIHGVVGHSSTIDGIFDLTYIPSHNFTLGLCLRKCDCLLGQGTVARFLLVTR